VRFEGLKLKDKDMSLLLLWLDVMKQVLSAELNIAIMRIIPS
jgi:hypothetical protein